MAVTESRLKKFLSQIGADFDKVAKHQTALEKCTTFLRTPDEGRDLKLNDLGSTIRGLSARFK